MQTPTDTSLLRRWQQQQDAHAFKALTQRYGGLVFGICHRVLKNPADAEEITQECFLKLAQNPSIQERALGPWLHSVAVHASLNRIRAGQRRRDREAAYEAVRPRSVEYVAGDLLEHVDEAIGQLPDDLRHCIVGSFLESKPQGDVAAELGVSTRTVRRKTDEAIGRIRELLRQRGITASAGGLAATLAGLKADALSPALSASLGKIAVGGGVHVGTANRAAAGTTTTKGGVIAMKKAIVLSVGAVAIAGAVWWGVTRPGPVEEIEPRSARTNSTPSPQTASAEPGHPTPLDTAASVEPVNAEGISPATVASLPAPSDIPPIANPTKYGALSGRVEDLSGRAVPGANVTLLASGVGAADDDAYYVPGFPRVPHPADKGLAARQRSMAREAAYELPDHQYETNTDGDGQFLISGIRYAGMALVFAFAEGLSMEQATVEIGEDATAETHLILGPAKAIHGKVITAEGAAVTDATVDAVAVTAFASSPGGMGGGGGGGNRPPLPKAVRAHTDTDGSFNLWLANAAQAALRVESELRGTDVFPDIPTGSDEVITLALDPERGTLAGQVLLSDNTPAADYLVHLFGTSRFPDGASHFNGAESGVFGGGGGFQSGGFGGGGSGGSGGSFDSGSGGMPAMQVPVSGSNFQVETDDGGLFQLDALPTSQTYTAVIYTPDGRKRAKTDVPPLAPNETTDWTYVVEEPLRVTGRVVGATTGKGLAGAVVRGAPAGDPDIQMMLNMKSTTTDADGNFTLELLTAEGMHQLTAAVDPSAHITSKDPTAQMVELRRGEPQEIHFTLPDPWSRKFRLVDPAWRPVAGASAEVTERQESGGGSGMTSRPIDGPGTDAEGRLAVNKLSGAAEVQVTFSKVGYFDAKSSPLTGVPGQVMPEETVVCYPLASASARVLDSAGQPLANTELLCRIRYGTDGQIVLQTATNVDGWLVLEENLPAAEIELELRLPAPEGQGGTGAFGGFGNVPPQVREMMARQQMDQAEAANTAHGVLTGLVLVEGAMNELGDIVLSTDNDPGVQ